MPLIVAISMNRETFLNPPLSSSSLLIILMVSLLFAGCLIAIPIAIVVRKMTRQGTGTHLLEQGALLQQVQVMRQQS